MKKLKTISALLAVMILLSAFSACSGNDTQSVESSKESSLDNVSIESSQSSKAEESLASRQESSLVESSNKETDEISEKISKMSLDEKIGQMLMVGIDGTEVDDDFKEFAEEYKFGTVILFGKNITSAEQLVNLTNSIKSTAGDIPYIIGMDEEGGLVTRLPDDVLSMPAALTIAGSEDTEYCYNAGYQIGTQITSFGLHTGFSPVLDIWSNPDNTVIGNRAYGKTSDDVCKYGIADMLGLKASGAIPVAKHFPGHGDTETDSHYGLPLVTKTKEELWQSELLPFKSAIENGVPMIMAAHILCTELDEKYPASMSKNIITDLLRDEMGFEGVVITDDLTMGAISESYSFGDAAVLSINAGCDILSICFGEDNVKQAFTAIKEAVKNGDITEERINESVRRILKLKEDYNVTSESVEMPDVDELNSKTAKFQ
ncbi:MAG: beta-N-acetylhexosaminidase [Candidatus Pseudoruminococcus sp.]|nr:beta-N-acetylhexosaminidase [Ruminococcus sp.]MDY2782446.1 beta-N-acetylhexosaminidase [Candidatus Pseudoruminococcus sp.]